MNYDDCYHRSWREEIRLRGHDGLSWRIASQFYRLLGWFYAMDRAAISIQREHFSAQNHIEGDKT